MRSCLLSLFLLVGCSSLPPAANTEIETDSNAAGNVGDVICDLVQGPIRRTHSDSFGLPPPRVDEVMEKLGIIVGAFSEFEMSSRCFLDYIPVKQYRDYYREAFACRLGPGAPDECADRSPQGWTCIACEVESTQVTLVALRAAYGDPGTIVILADIIKGQAHGTQVGFLVRRTAHGWALIKSSTFGVI